MKIILAIYYIYHILFFMFSLGLSRSGTGVPRGLGNSRLAVFVPAHNEETVIYKSVKSILASNYPRDKFDIYVIADNCTDRTEELALAAGANVLKRKNKTLRGKQHALSWAFKQIDTNDYDGVIVLDADNHVESDFLSVIDYHLDTGHSVIQGYVATKNPADSWVTANYAYMFWYICRLQMARTKIGLSAWLAGTGWCVSTEVLRRVGWNVNTLVDDVEYTCRLILAGERVAFAPGAVFYDQKPVGLRDSMKQRLRWIRGQTQVTIQLIPRMIWHIAKCWLRGDVAGAARAFDAVMWVPMHIVIFASFAGCVAGGGFLYFLGALLSIPTFYFLPLIVEKITNWRVWGYIVTAGIFYFTWIPVVAYGVFTYGQKGWWRTPH